MLHRRRGRTKFAPCNVILRIRLRANTGDRIE